MKKLVCHCGAIEAEINLVGENKIIEPNSNSEEPRLFNGLNRRF